jgi:hypothetical protein
LFSFSVSLIKSAFLAKNSCMNFQLMRYSSGAFVMNPLIGFLSAKAAYFSTPFGGFPVQSNICLKQLEFPLWQRKFNPNA